MPEEYGFGDYATEPTRLCQSNKGGDQMNQKADEVAHCGNDIKTRQALDFGPLLAFAMNTLGELKLSHVGGDVTAKIETDRLATPTSMLREIVLEGIKHADPNAHIIYEEQRIVNGRQILAIQFSLNIQGKRSRVLGYYHGGSSGCIQVIAYTSDSKFADNRG